MKHPDKFQTRKIVQSVHLIMIHFNLTEEGSKFIYRRNYNISRFSGGPFHVQIDMVKRIRQNPLGLNGYSLVLRTRCDTGHWKQNIFLNAPFIRSSIIYLFCSFK